MSEMMNNKISEEQLNKVAGGNDGMGEGTFSAYDISPRWVRVTASELNCRYWPNGDVAKTYERITALDGVYQQIFKNFTSIRITCKIDCCHLLYVFY